MLFKRAVQRYGRTPEPETPYQRAGQLWDERIGSARVQARNWRLMAFGGLAPDRRPLRRPRLAVDAEPGRALCRRGRPARRGAGGRAGRRRAIARPIRRSPGTSAASSRNVRSVSLDPVLMRENWLSAYDFATERGALFLGEYARAADPFADVGERPSRSRSPASCARRTARSRSSGPRPPMSAAASPAPRAGPRS